MIKNPKLLLAVCCSGALAVAYTSDTPGSTTSSSGTSSSTSSSTSSAASSAAGSVVGSATRADGAFYTSAPCPNPLVEEATSIDLGSEFDCGYLTVPENRTEPPCKSIRLAVARVKATDPNPNPIV